MNCPQCDLDTGGNHKWDCPNNPRPHIGREGMWTYIRDPQPWICPKCGGVMGPTQPTCMFCRPSDPDNRPTG